MRPSLAGISRTNTIGLIGLGAMGKHMINNPDPTVFSSTTATTTTPPPSHRNYPGGFVTALAHKDLALAVSAAAQSGTPLRLGECAEQAYQPLSKSED